MSGLPHFSAFEDYACALAALGASERSQVQTADTLELHACRFYPHHLKEVCKDAGHKFDNNLMKKNATIWSMEISCQRRPLQKRIYHRFKHTIKPYYLNTLNPILLTCLNKDGTIPSGKTREDMLKEVLVKLYDQTHGPKRKVAGLVDENGHDDNGVHHQAVMPDGWQGPVHFYGWSLLGPLSPTMPRPAFALNASNASAAARQPGLATPRVELEVDGGNSPPVMSASTPPPSRVVGNGQASRAHQRLVVAQHGSFAKGGITPSQDVFNSDSVTPSTARHLPLRNINNKVASNTQHVQAANILAASEQRKLLLEMSAQQRQSRSSRVEELKLLLSIVDPGSEEHQATKAKLVALLSEEPPAPISINDLMQAPSKDPSNESDPPHGRASGSPQQEVSMHKRIRSGVCTSSTTCRMHAYITAANLHL